MFWCLREVLKGSSVLFFSLRSLTVKHVATEEQSRARGGHGCCSGGDELGRGSGSRGRWVLTVSLGRRCGNRGRWVLAVSLRGSFRLQVQCLPLFGRLQYGKLFLDVQTIKKRVWGGGEMEKANTSSGIWLPLQLLT